MERIHGKDNRVKCRFSIIKPWSQADDYLMHNDTAQNCQNTICRSEDHSGACIKKCGGRFRVRHAWKHRSNMGKWKIVPANSFKRHIQIPLVTQISGSIHDRKQAFSSLRNANIQTNKLLQIFSQHLIKGKKMNFWGIDRTKPSFMNTATQNDT